MSAVGRSPAMVGPAQYPSEGDAFLNNVLVYFEFYNCLMEMCCTKGKKIRINLIALPELKWRPEPI